MIQAYTGKTGSGKTYLMVKDAFKAWKLGRTIYSNTKLEFEKRASKWTLRKAGRIKYFEHINEIINIKDGLVLFDEAQVLFNARSWESLPEEFQYKLQQHRKHKIDLICTTQNMGTIDITYRRLVHHWIHCHNLFQIGKSPKILIGIFKKEYKDVDYLYNSVDDLQVPTIKNRWLFIWYFSPVLYDTMFDIGFKRFKLVWVSKYDSLTKNPKKMYLIIPKKMSLSKALTAIRLSNSLFQLKSLKNSKRN